MSARQAIFPIKTMARVVTVSASGFYAWRGRPASARVTADRDLRRRLRTIPAAACGSHGAARLHAEVKAEGVAIGKTRVARPMPAAGPVGARRRRRVTTTRREPKHRPAQARVRRNFFVASAWSSRTSCGEPTSPACLRAPASWSWLSGWTPGRVGSSAGPSRPTSRPASCATPATGRSLPESVIQQSDQRAQDSALAFGRRGQDAAVRPATGSLGDACDTAICASVFATRASEPLDRQRCRTHSKARMAVVHVIEGVCNPSRHHSAPAYLAPIADERTHHQLT
jgi:putative transposase